MTTGTKIIVAVMGIAIAGLSVVLVRCCIHNDESSKKIEKFDEYCLHVKLSLRDDWHDFEDPNPAKQEVALKRFYESNVRGHSASDIIMCASKPWKKGPEYDLCWLAKDFGCLARVAHSAEQAIEYDLD